MNLNWKVLRSGSILATRRNSISTDLRFKSRKLCFSKLADCIFRTLIFHLGAVCFAGALSKMPHRQGQVAWRCRSRPSRPVFTASSVSKWLSSEGVSRSTTGTWWSQNLKIQNDQINRLPIGMLPRSSAWHKKYRNISTPKIWTLPPTADLHQLLSQSVVIFLPALPFLTLPTAPRNSSIPAAMRFFHKPPMTLTSRLKSL